MSVSIKATRRDWLGLVVIALPCILYAMDLTVLDLALPKINADLHPTSAQMLWIVDIYGFMVAGSLITMGTLGDRIGRRRLLMIGAAAFGVGSTAAAFSTSASMLIATRALLGVAGATLAPSTLSLIRNMFLDSKQRTVAIGIWAMSYSLGGAIGPVVGGVLLEHYWWGSVFLIATPIMVLLLIAAPLVLPEFRAPATHPVDLISVAQSVTAVLAMIYGLKEIAENGFDVTALTFIVAGGAMAAVFIRRQRQLDAPLIDLTLFRSRAFSMPLVMYLVATFVAFGGFLFTAQYLQLVFGLSPLRAGLWLLPTFAGYIIGSVVTAPISERVRPEVVTFTGMIVAATGFALLALVPSDGLTLLAIGSFAFSIGLAPVVTLATDAIVGAAPAAQAGIASAISETSSELGGALGIAMLGSFGTAVYRWKAGAPRGTPAATLSGAISLAARLHGGARADLLRTARAAYADAFAMTVLACCVIVLLTAFAARSLRSSSTESEAAVRGPEGGEELGRRRESTARLPRALPRSE